MTTSTRRRVPRRGRQDPSELEGLPLDVTPADEPSSRRSTRRRTRASATTTTPSSSLAAASEEETAPEDTAAKSAARRSFRKRGHAEANSEEEEEEDNNEEEDDDDIPLSKRSSGKTSRAKRDSTQGDSPDEPSAAAGKRGRKRTQEISESNDDGSENGEPKGTSTTPRRSTPLSETVAGGGSDSEDDNIPLNQLASRRAQKRGASSGDDDDNDGAVPKRKRGRPKAAVTSDTGSAEAGEDRKGGRIRKGRRRGPDGTEASDEEVKGAAKTRRKKRGHNDSSAGSGDETLGDTSNNTTQRSRRITNKTSVLEAVTGSGFGDDMKSKDKGQFEANRASKRQRSGGAVSAKGGRKTKAQTDSEGKEDKNSTKRGGGTSSNLENNQAPVAKTSKKGVPSETTAGAKLSGGIDDAHVVGGSKTSDKTTSGKTNPVSDGVPRKDGHDGVREKEETEKDPKPAPTKEGQNKTQEPSTSPTKPLSFLTNPLDFLAQIADTRIAFQSGARTQEKKESKPKGATKVAAETKPLSANEGAKVAKQGQEPTVTTFKASDLVSMAVKNYIATAGDKRASENVAQVSTPNHSQDLVKDTTKNEIEDPVLDRHSTRPKGTKGESDTVTSEQLQESNTGTGIDESPNNAASESQSELASSQEQGAASAAGEAKEEQNDKPVPQKYEESNDKTLVSEKEEKDLSEKEAKMQHQKKEDPGGLSGETQKENQESEQQSRSPSSVDVSESSEHPATKDKTVGSRDDAVDHQTPPLSTDNSKNEVGDKETTDQSRETEAAEITTDRAENDIARIEAEPQSIDEKEASAEVRDRPDIPKEEIKVLADGPLETCDAGNKESKSLASAVSDKAGDVGEAHGGGTHEEKAAVPEEENSNPVGETKEPKMDTDNEPQPSNREGCLPSVANPASVGARLDESHPSEASSQGGVLEEVPQTIGEADKRSRKESTPAEAVGDGPNVAVSAPEEGPRVTNSEQGEGSAEITDTNADKSQNGSDSLKRFQVSDIPAVGQPKGTDEIQTSDESSDVNNKDNPEVNEVPSPAQGEHSRETKDRAVGSGSEGDKLDTNEPKEKNADVVSIEESSPTKSGQGEQSDGDIESENLDETVAPTLQNAEVKGNGDVREAERTQQPEIPSSKTEVASAQKFQEEQKTGSAEQSIPPDSGALDVATQDTKLQMIVSAPPSQTSEDSPDSVLTELDSKGDGCEGRGPNQSIESNSTSQALQPTKEMSSSLAGPKGEEITDPHNMNPTSSEVLAPPVVVENTAVSDAQGNKDLGENLHSEKVEAQIDREAKNADASGKTTEQNKSRTDDVIESSTRSSQLIDGDAKTTKEDPKPHLGVKETIESANPKPDHHGSDEQSDDVSTRGTSFPNNDGAERTAEEGDKKGAEGALLEPSACGLQNKAGSNDNRSSHDEKARDEMLSASVTTAFSAASKGDGDGGEGGIDGVDSNNRVPKEDKADSASGCDGATPGLVSDDAVEESKKEVELRNTASPREVNSAQKSKTRAESKDSLTSGNNTQLPPEVLNKDHDAAKAAPLDAGTTPKPRKAEGMQSSKVVESAAIDKSDGVEGEACLEREEKVEKGASEGKDDQSGEVNATAPSESAPQTEDTGAKESASSDHHAAETHSRLNVMPEMPSFEFVFPDFAEQNTRSTIGSMASRKDMPPSTDRFDLMKVKMQLYAAGLKAHRGRGSQHLFAGYWGAVSKCMSIHHNRGLLRQQLKRTREVISRFLVTKKLKRLHNSLILGLMNRCFHGTAPANEVNPVIPQDLRRRVKSKRKQISKPQPPDQLLQEIDRDFHKDAVVWSSSIKRTAFEQPQESVDYQKIRDEYGESASSSSCIPGALSIDPMVRKVAQETGMKVTENAVWLTVIGLREYMKKTLNSTVSGVEAMKEGKLLFHAPQPDFSRSSPKPAGSAPSSPAKPTSNAPKAAINSTKKTRISALDLAMNQMSHQSWRRAPQHCVERCLQSSFPPIQSLVPPKFESVQNYFASGIQVKPIENERRRTNPARDPNFAPPSTAGALKATAGTSSVRQPSPSVPQRRSPPGSQPDNASAAAMKQKQASIAGGDQPHNSSSKSRQSVAGMGRGAKNLAALRQRATTPQRTVKSPEQRVDKPKPLAPAERPKGKPEIARLRQADANHAAAAPKSTKQQQQQQTQAQQPPQRSKGKSGIAQLRQPLDNAGEAPPLAKPQTAQKQQPEQRPKGKPGVAKLKQSVAAAASSLPNSETSNEVKAAGTAGQASPKASDSTRRPKGSEPPNKGLTAQAIDLTASEESGDEKPEEKKEGEKGGVKPREGSKVEDKAEEKLRSSPPRGRGRGFGVKDLSAMKSRSTLSGDDKSNDSS